MNRISDDENYIPPTIKIILLGDFGVGKTTLRESIITLGLKKDLSQFQADIDESQEPQYKERTFKLGRDYVKFQIWDTLDMEKYNNDIPSMYFHDIDVALICFDMTNKKSFENVIHWMEVLDEHAVGDDHIIGLVGTKNENESELQVFESEVFAVYNGAAAFICFVTQTNQKTIGYLSSKIYTAVFPNDDPERKKAEEEESLQNMSFLDRSMVKIEKNCFNH